MRVDRIILCATLTLAFSTVALAAPRISATDKGLRAEGITPGGNAVWFGGTIDEYASTRRLTPHALTVHDEDRDGIVELAMNPVPQWILLTVVDADTGEYGLLRGEGVDGIELDLHGNNWRSGLSEFDVVADFLQMLLVRPGDGAWTKRAAEGGTGDGDRTTNGRFRLKINDMVPLQAGRRPPGGVRRGDLLMILNPQTLQYVIRAAKD